MNHFIVTLLIEIVLNEKTKGIYAMNKVKLIMSILTCISTISVYTMEEPRLTTKKILLEVKIENLIKTAENYKSQYRKGDIQKPSLIAQNLLVIKQLKEVQKQQSPEEAIKLDIIIQDLDTTTATLIEEQHKKPMQEEQFAKQTEKQVADAIEKDKVLQQRLTKMKEHEIEAKTDEFIKLWQEAERKKELAEKAVKKEKENLGLASTYFEQFVKKQKPEINEEIRKGTWSGILTRQINKIKQNFYVHFAPFLMANSEFFRGLDDNQFDQLINRVHFEEFFTQLNKAVADINRNEDLGRINKKQQNMLIEFLNDIMLTISFAQKIYVYGIFNHQIRKPLSSTVVHHMDHLVPKMKKYTDIAYRQGVLGNINVDTNFKLVEQGEDHAIQITLKTLVNEWESIFNEADSKMITVEERIMLSKEGIKLGEYIIYYLKTFNPYVIKKQFKSAKGKSHPYKRTNFYISRMKKKLTMLKKLYMEPPPPPPKKLTKIESILTEINKIEQDLPNLTENFSLVTNFIENIKSIENSLKKIKLQPKATKKAQQTIDRLKEAIGNEQMKRVSSELNIINKSLTILIRSTIQTTDEAESLCNSLRSAMTALKPIALKGLYGGTKDRFDNYLKFALKQNNDITQLFKQAIQQVEKSMKLFIKKILNDIKNNSSNKTLETKLLLCGKILTSGLKVYRNIFMPYLKEQKLPKKKIQVKQLALKKEKERREEQTQKLKKDLSNFSKLIDGDEKQGIDGIIDRLWYFKSGKWSQKKLKEEQYLNFIKNVKNNIGFKNTKQAIEKIQNKIDQTKFSDEEKIKQFVKDKNQITILRRRYILYLLTTLIKQLGDSEKFLTNIIKKQDPKNIEKQVSSHINLVNQIMNGLYNAEIVEGDYFIILTPDIKPIGFVIEKAKTVAEKMTEIAKLIQEKANLIDENQLTELLKQINMQKEEFITNYNIHMEKKIPTT